MNETPERIVAGIGVVVLLIFVGAYLAQQRPRVDTLPPELAAALMREMA